VPVTQGLERRAIVEALGAALVVTVVVTIASATLPDKYVATVVGGIFLLATWVFVWRGDDQRVEAAGLALGGIVLPGKIDLGRLTRSLVNALGWAFLAAAITFVPFYFGWRTFWRPHGHFSLHLAPYEAINEIFGQLVIIALPEEAFYRGYIQSRLDEAIPGFGWRRDPTTGERTPLRPSVLGTTIGPALFITSAVFAIGHFATIREPARFAVFFPSLAFGWLRYRTKGVGAGIAFHAMCNLFSEALGRGFHLY
jgi:membrane protease YdiL (CAAX protease family)